MAYSPKVDETHWASVNEQWLVWQHEAQCRAQACKTERLPEPLLTEVLNKLHSLDHLWKIALCGTFDAFLEILWEKWIPIRMPD